MHFQYSQREFLGPGPFHRQLPQTHAKHTIWQDTKLDTLYDEILETQLALRQYHEFSTSRSVRFLKDIKTFRRIIRFARADRSKMLPELVQKTTLALHMEILNILEEFPTDLLPFSSFNEFNPDVGDSYLPQMPAGLGRAGTDILQFILVLLSMLCYLHLPSIQSGSGTAHFFLLKKDGIKLFSGKEVMFTGLRILGHLCSIAYIPLGQSSIFYPFCRSPSTSGRSLSASPLMFEATSGIF